MVKKSSIDYRIYCPSYKRSNIAISHKLFKKDVFTYVVREEEANLYEKFGVDLMIIPKGKVNCIASTRNWILDNKKSDYITMVDDDTKHIQWLINRNIYKLNPEELHHVCLNGYQMAIDCGAGIWGMNVNGDPLAYQINKPFGFADMILGPFMCIVDTELRFDENLPLKEDYDISLQCLHKHGKTLRFNYLSYEVDHQTLPGGCQAYRTSKREEEQNKLLQKKWGSDIIRKNPRKDRNTINMIVKTGL
jgi:hypothetical protein